MAARRAGGGAWLNGSGEALPWRRRFTAALPWRRRFCGGVASATALCGGVAMAAQQRPRYFTPREVAAAARRGRPWLSALGRVFDLEPVLRERRGDPSLRPLLEALGTDISHWFDPQTGEPRTRVDPRTGCVSFRSPGAALLGDPPPTPSSDWVPPPPWWRDPRREVGLLSAAPRLLRLLNTLTGQQHLLEVCGEETVEDIQRRALPWNANARNYTWRSGGVTLHPTLTLEENGVPDDTPELLRLAMDPVEFATTVLLYFRDNFSEL
ncbi:cytochrome b5 domain-containing protein 1 [Anas platyrhynchos]|uniref:cytochrome b5 domain-containing protein 1 n=1 Tax=Anas platyrhynchos TaxID=8839 RepID=UPI003AF25BAD